MDADETMAEQTVFSEDIMANQTLVPDEIVPNQTVFSAASSASDPIWIDKVWLDTVVVVGLTCFILCLMGLSKVSLRIQRDTSRRFTSVKLLTS